MVKSGGNKAATDGVNKEMKAPIMVRRTKYLNNIAEQDDRSKTAPIRL